MITNLAFGVFLKYEMWFSRQRKAYFRQRPLREGPSMYFITICTTDEAVQSLVFVFSFPPTVLPLSRFVFLMPIVKESSSFPETEAKACATRRPGIKAECLPCFPHLSELWPGKWKKNGLLCVSEPSCAVRRLDCLGGFFFSPCFGGGFVILWHAKTLILESVKLLKRESVHGGKPDFFFALCVFLISVFACMFQTVFWPTLVWFPVSGIIINYYYFTILKQCQWRSAVVTRYLLSACPLMFTWTWSWRVFDLIPRSSVVQRTPDTSACCLTKAFSLLALALPRCLVMLSRLPLLMLLAASKGNKWF